MRLCFRFGRDTHHNVPCAMCELRKCFSDQVDKQHVSHLHTITHLHSKQTCTAAFQQLSPNVAVPRIYTSTQRLFFLPLCTHLITWIRDLIFAFIFAFVHATPTISQLAAISYDIFVYFTLLIANYIIQECARTEEVFD